MYLICYSPIVAQVTLGKHTAFAIPESHFVTAFMYHYLYLQYDTSHNGPQRPYRSNKKFLEVLRELPADTIKEHLLAALEGGLRENALVAIGPADVLACSEGAFDAVESKARLCTGTEYQKS